MGSQIVSLLDIKKRVGPRSHVTHSEQSNHLPSFNIKPWESQSPKEGPHQVGPMQQLLAMKPYNHYSPDAVKMAHVAHAVSPYSLTYTLSHTVRDAWSQINSPPIKKQPDSHILCCSP